MIKEMDLYNSNFIKNRNIKFRLKDIFSDHWDNFVNAYSNIDIRPAVHKEKIPYKQKNSQHLTY